MGWYLCMRKATFLRNILKKFWIFRMRICVLHIPTTFETIDRPLWKLALFSSRYLQPQLPTFNFELYKYQHLFNGNFTGTNSKESFTAESWISVPDIFILGIYASSYKYIIKCGALRSLFRPSFYVFIQWRNVEFDRW